MRILNFNLLYAFILSGYRKTPERKKGMKLLRVQETNCFIDAIRIDEMRSRKCVKPGDLC